MNNFEPFSDIELYLFAILIDPGLGRYFIRRKNQRSYTPSKKDEDDGKIFQTKLANLQHTQAYIIQQFRDAMFLQGDPLRIMEGRCMQDELDIIQENW